MSEGLGVVHPQGWVPQYIEDRDIVREIEILPDKEEDDPVLIEARSEVERIAARLPPRWRVIFLLRAQGTFQADIAQVVGSCQPTICENLQAIARVLPALLETRPVSAEEIEEWVRLGMKRKLSGLSKRVRLVTHYLSGWNQLHAAHAVGLSQTGARWVLVSDHAPDHPVGQLLKVIRTTSLHSTGRTRRGQRPLADRIAYEEKWDRLGI